MYELLIVVVLVVCVTALLLGYFALVQRKHYDVTMAALGRVGSISVRETSTFAYPATVASAEAVATPAPLTIEGVRTVTVGRPSERFAVTGGLPAGATVSWRVEPAGRAGVEQESGGGLATRLYPVAEGPLTVVASVTAADGTVSHQGAFQATAVEAPVTRSLELPWVGQGVGTLVVSVMILGIVLYLADDGVLGSAVVATIVTAIAGYVFGSRATNGR